MDLVAAEFGVTKEKMAGFDRHKPIPDARHAFILIAYRMGHNQQQIANALNCCLSTVEKGIKVAQNKSDTESAFRWTVDYIQPL